MVRWEPGTKERLQAAALELYLTRGFEQTTVTDIAESVGLTERTFFRHFGDKREVLFHGQDVLQRHFRDAVAAAPQDAGAFALVTVAVAASADYFPAEKRPLSRRRQTVIAANPALQERELLKLARLSTTLTEALRERGVAEPTATIAADAAVAVFSSAFARWIAPGEERSFAELVRDSLRALTELAGAPSRPAAPGC